MLGAGDAPGTKMCIVLSSGELISSRGWTTKQVIGIKCHESFAQKSGIGKDSRRRFQDKAIALKGCELKGSSVWSKKGTQGMGLELREPGESCAGRDWTGGLDVVMKDLVSRPRDFMLRMLGSHGRVSTGEAQFAFLPLRSTAGSSTVGYWTEAGSGIERPPDQAWP